jgi:hypothetical protein
MMRKSSRTEPVRWARGATRLGPGLESYELSLHQTPDTVFTDASADLGAAWLSPVNGGTPKPGASDQHCYRRAPLVFPSLPPSSEPVSDSGRTLLKQQIPIRTFAQWDDAQPGFLEADLVGHHGGDIHGCFLYTLTLTDIATGWTECFPLLYKSPEAVLTAFQQARRRFPFPILGLDTDNGSEFINEAVMRYCEAEQITFTRGRPEVKNDQCFVEQKKGAVVRQFVGNGRFVGFQASRQLHELYRALRLYVNCFQPSMKLVSKHVEEGNVCRVYDPAKTPLQTALAFRDLA